MESARDGAASREIVYAAIVNHNTSLFAELALRSLVASVGAGDRECDLRITVLDNHSTDDVESLLAAANEASASFELTRWPAADATFNTHGDVLPRLRAGPAGRRLLLARRLGH